MKTFFTGKFYLAFQVVSLLIILLPNNAFAQWQPSGPDSYILGNVGIGTTNPNAKLHVSGTSPNIRLGSTAAAENFNGKVAGITFSRHYDVFTSAEICSYAQWAKEEYAGGELRFATTPPNSYGTGGLPLTDRMVINSIGNVGIGTTNPQHRLEVSNGQTVLRGSAGSVALSIIENSSSSVGAHFTSEGANNIMFQLKRTADGLTNTELRTGGNSYINAISGNVGIGTTNPNQKLTVNGTIYGKEVKVDIQVPGPDYVFEKDYALLSLDKVQSFIAEHKHLPEVPSAKEMEANGINLSEMNLLLLKKIEELTLYQIEANKRIQKLEEAVNYLSRK